MNENPIPWYRRWWFILVGALVMLLLIAVGWSWYRDWQIQKELEAYLTQFDRSEPNWRFEDWIKQRPELPDQENLAKVAWEMRQKIVPEPPRFDTLFQNANRYPDHLYDAEQLKLLKELLAKAGDLQADANHLLKLRTGQFPSNYMENPTFKIWTVVLEPQQRLRGVANLLSYQAQLWAQEGKGDEGLLLCRALLHLAHAYDQDPYLISQLIAMAIQSQSMSTIERVLAQTEPSESVLQELQADLLHETEISLFERGMRGDRACCDRTFSEIEDGKYTRQEMLRFFGPRPRGTGLSWEGFVDQLRLWVKGTSFKSIPEERLRALQFYDEMIRLARGPEVGRWDRIKEHTLLAASRSAVISAMGPAGEKIYEAEMKRQAMLRATATLIAAERYRREKGKLPIGWNDLVPKYLPAIPTDPYDGQQLRWKQTDDGLILYSIWMKRIDDGGKIRFDESSGPKDCGVQMWDVKYHRQPPVPAAEETETNK